MGGAVSGGDRLRIGRLEQLVGLGPVTSIALTMPAGFSVSGSPGTGAANLVVTYSGTIPSSSIPGLGGDVTGTISTNTVTAWQGVPVANATAAAANIMMYSVALSGWGSFAISGDLVASTLTLGQITVGTNKITNAKAAQMAANTVKSNLTGSTANAVDNTLDKCRASLDAADYVGSTSGTGTYTATLAPVPTAYGTGQEYNLVFTSTNTTATPTLNLNSLGAKTLKKDGATLGIGQLRAGSMHTMTYDGTDLQVTTPLPAPVLLAHITGINLKTVANTALYTVPTGKTALITQALVNCTAATAITVAATAGVGVSGSDIYAAVVMTGLTATTKCWGWSTQGLIANVAAASVINFNVTGAATGTSQTADCMLFGYLF